MGLKNDLEIKMKECDIGLLVTVSMPYMHLDLSSSYHSIATKSTGSSDYIEPWSVRRSDASDVNICLRLAAVIDPDMPSAHPMSTLR